MTRKELKEEVWDLIDQDCLELTQEEYLYFLEELRDDADIRAEVVRHELDNQ